MDNHLKEALEIVKAQASVRTMTEDELTSMLQRLTRDIRSISDAMPIEEVEAPETDIDASKAIKEKTITCVECGRSFKLLTKKHLATHGLTPEEYRAKCGYKKNTPLVCKALQRERRKKMKDMRLWERRTTAAK
ncbi:MAG: MucR family transcriptional regulator [Deltaproteobacteria bacterium]|jgi:predicted transcriptional regulator|nr:MucR family transcriptional regulator [Deltaproteobacteria bacterium]